MTKQNKVITKIVKHTSGIDIHFKNKNDVLFIGNTSLTLILEHHSRYACDETNKKLFLTSDKLKHFLEKKEDK